MNKEQIYKHSDVIKWFCDNPDSMVWYQQRISKNWVLTDAPAFGAHTSYVQNDEYAELRKAQANGKTIEVLCSGVFQTSGCLFNRLPEDYRIKPDKPKFKEGDWVRDIVNHKTIQLGTHYHKGGIELWKPTKNEWCVFWKYDKVYVVRQFQFPKHKIWVDSNNEYWDNIAPLEFVQTLKSKS